MLVSQFQPGPSEKKEMKNAGWFLGKSRGREQYPNNSHLGPGKSQEL
jgi:hypothetical protein